MHIGRDGAYILHAVAQGFVPDTVTGCVKVFRFALFLASHVAVLYPCAAYSFRFFCF